VQVQHWFVSSHTIMGGKAQREVGLDRIAEAFETT
jgi:hypothetical protein